MNWRYEQTTAGITICDSNGKAILFDPYIDTSTARRIVACINFCDGILVEELENNLPPEDAGALRKRITELESQINDRRRNDEDMRAMAP